MAENTTDYLVAYSDYLRACGRSQHTISLRKMQVRSLLEEYKDPWRITSDDLIDWLSKHKKWSKATRSSYRDGLRGFFGWLVETNRMGTSPADKIPKVRVPPRVARPAPTEAIVEALNSKDERVRLMVELSVRCGLRRAEISSVHSRDIQSDISGPSLVVHGKGDRERIIPLDENFAEKLLSMPKGWLFPTKDGANHLSAKYVGALVTKALPGAWTTHTLRHHFATSAYAGTGDLLAVQQLLGHSNVSTTQRYVAIPNEGLRAACAAVKFPDSK